MVFHNAVTWLADDIFIFSANEHVPCPLLLTYRDRLMLRRPV
jgi:hypothetical protein